MKRFFGALSILLITAWAMPSATAQILLSGAKVHTVVGETYDPGYVLIGADGRISQVGEGNVDPTTPPWNDMKGLSVVDATGQVLTPGLIDAQTSLGLVEIWAVDATRDVDSGGGTIRAGFLASDGFHHGAVAIPTTRRGGVSSVVVRPSGGLVSGTSAWVSLRDDRFHARVQEPAVAVQMVAGSSGGRATGGSRANVWMLLRELYGDLRYFVANRKAFDNNRIRPLSTGRIHLEALERTLNKGIPVVFDVDRANDILAALRFAEEEGLRLIVAGGAQAWLVADELAATQTTVIVDPLRNLPSRFDALGQREDAAVRLLKAGVPVAFSTFEGHNVRNLRFLAGNAVRAGVPYEQALRAITLAPAEAFGMAGEYGSIEPTKRADLALWSGDPFEPSTRLLALYIDGQTVSLSDRQSELMKRYRTLQERGQPASRSLPPATTPPPTTAETKEHHVD